MGGILSKQPVLVGNAVGAAIGLLVALGLRVSPEVKDALVALVIAMFTLFAHQSVIAPATAAALVADAATATAAALNPQTAGDPGEVTPGGQQVVNQVVEGVTAEVGGLAGSALRDALPGDEGTVVI